MNKPTNRFDDTAPVRQVGLTPSSLVASSMALNRVQQLGIDSGKAAEALQEAIAKVFIGVEDLEQAEIKKASQIVRNDPDIGIMKFAAGAQRYQSFIKNFKEKYTGDMYPNDAAVVGYEYSKLALGI